MQPSSLVFVAIVGIWAAFLVQHWVRRRENMATARSVDRFSESIRMLERQPVVPSPAARPDVRAYAVASPFVARRTTASPTASATGPASGSTLVSGSVSGPTGPARPATTGALRTASRARPRPRRGPRSRRELLGRRIRGLAFLGVLAFVPVTVLLSALGVLVWGSVGVSVGCLALGVFLLRYAAVRERTRQRLDASIAASVDRALGPERAAVAGPLASRAGGTAPGHATEVGRDADTLADTEATQPAATAKPAEPAARGTWTPVPVPRPTYALKAVVERPQPVPAEVTPTPEIPAAHREDASPAERTAAG